MWRGHAISMSVAAARADTNPYAPPRIDSSAAWAWLAPERWHELHLVGQLISQRPMERVVRLAGSIDAEIYYDARLVGEQVYVNGRLAGRSSLWYWSLVAPTIDFAVDGERYRVPARVDVAVGFSWRSLVAIKRFELWVAGRVVYVE
jgi:hypothetical protein